MRRVLTDIDQDGILPPVFARTERPPQGGLRSFWVLEKYQKSLQLRRVLTDIDQDGILPPVFARTERPPQGGLRSFWDHIG
ncbi:MAG: hypothetical protein OEM94_02130, partial [Acidimicrobiia bacterium]|nr:hypothetical protein [Acidimicrobiia bacterium]